MTFNKTYFIKITISNELISLSVLIKKNVLSLILLNYSGPEDMVFVNFVDHGGVGILCFPSENLYADDLENTLRKMAKKQQFKKVLNKN